MTRDVVAEVYRPREIGRSAVGVVGEAGEETSDTADGDAKSEGNGVEIAGGEAESDVVLHEFHREQAEDQGADDGLASEEVGGIVEIEQRLLRVLEPEQEFGAERGSAYGCSDDGPAERRGDGISEAAAESEVDQKGDEIGERLEKKMRMNGVAAEVEIDGERCGGMVYQGDGEL
jgi:hypothetical protein